MAANTGITHLRGHGRRVLCGNRRAQMWASVEAFRALLAAPDCGPIGDRACRRCADKLAASDARKVAR